MAGFLKLVGTLIILMLIYIGAFVANVLPLMLSPDIAFPEQYKQLSDYLMQDANSGSGTAALSKKAYNYMHARQTTNQALEQAAEAKEQQQKAQDEAQNPINKAKAGIQDYENKVNEEKKQLDNI